MAKQSRMWFCACGRIVMESEGCVCVCVCMQQGVGGGLHVQVYCIDVKHESVTWLLHVKWKYGTDAQNKHEHKMKREKWNRLERICWGMHRHKEGKLSGVLQWINSNEYTIPALQKGRRRDGKRESGWIKTGGGSSGVTKSCRSGKTGNQIAHLDLWEIMCKNTGR